MGPGCFDLAIAVRDNVPFAKLQDPEIFVICTFYKEIEKLAQHIAATEVRLANPAFVDKAPPAVLEGARKQLADLRAKHDELRRLLAALG